MTPSIAGPCPSCHASRASSAYPCQLSRWPSRSFGDHSPPPRPAVVRTRGGSRSYSEKTSRIPSSRMRIARRRDGTSSALAAPIRPTLRLREPPPRRDELGDQHLAEQRHGRIVVVAVAHLEVGSFHGAADGDDA